MYVTLLGEPWLLWRAVDRHGAELDILLQRRREGCGEALLQADAALEPGAAQDRD
jgi:putative transposase